jgi:hypothetical protein
MVASQPVLAEQLSALIPQAPDEFSRVCIDGAQHALADTSNPLRFNFFSTALRIMFEHMMGALAPDGQIVQCPWFKAQNDKNIPTKGQRIIFAIQGGLSDDFVRDKLSIDVAPLRKKLVGAVETLSKHVHGRENTVIENVAKQDEVAQVTIIALGDFLTAYHECRSAILDPIVEELDNDAVDAFISETIESIDELSSHHSIEEISVNHISVGHIDAHEITYHVEGTISATLQWGSNSDLRRGDGAELDQSFEFFYDVKISLDDPWNLSAAEISHGVDTSDWWDAMMPDEK